MEAWCSSPLALENFVSLEVEAVHQAEEVGLVQVLEDPPRPVLQQLHTRTPGRRCYLSETNICQRRKRIEEMWDFGCRSPYAPLKRNSFPEGHWTQSKITGNTGLTPKPKTVKVSELGGSWLPISILESKFNVDSHLDSKPRP